MEGRRLGPYVIDRELGAGGMGRVYAATVTERAPGLDTGARVALKIVHPHLMEAPGFFQRFLQEARIGASIRHENVVRTFMADGLRQEGEHLSLLVMELVEGQDLRALLRELERLPEELCRHVAREIAKGLTAIHAAGVVHRDLKPENVLITPDHVVKVMDLGVARLADEQMRLSQSGAFVGSVEYAAPEQFKGGEIDGRTDLHALGVMLYELSSGRHPFRGGAFHEVLSRVCDSQPARLGEVNPQLSAFFEEVVHTLLVKDPRGRFSSATQLLAVLEEGEASTWWQERSRQMQEATRRPVRRIRIPRESAVHGREPELAMLRTLFAEAKKGNGQVALIEGEAGIGKSRLIDELVARLEADGEELQFLFGSYPPGGAATSAGGLSSAFREQFGEAGSAEHLGETPLLVRAFDAVLRGEPAPPGAVALTRETLGTCFVQAMRSLAAELPTIVLIDDLHFAPEEARAIFTALSLAAPGHRVLLVGTLRPGVPEDWVANLTRLDHVTRTVLQRLGPKDLAALLRDTFNSQQLAEQLAFQIATKSDGNPFFAFEIVRGLREGDFITRNDDGTWASTQMIDEIQIPSSVLDLVTARVSGLSEDERNLLDVAACCGFEFDPLLLGDVLGIGRIPLLRALGQIERAHRLVRAAGRRYVFDHHQVQEALYGSLSELLREEYHAALGDALESRAGAADTDPGQLDGTLCVTLCEHFLLGAQGDRAQRYVPAALQHLHDGQLLVQLAALGERALAVPGLLTGLQRARVLVTLAVTLDALARRGRQEECAREALRIAEELGDVEAERAGATALCAVLWRTARYDEAESVCNRAIECARALGNPVHIAQGLGRLGSIRFERGHFDDARELFEHTLAVESADAGSVHVAISTMNLGNALAAVGRFAEARELFDRSLALHEAADNPLGTSSVLLNLGVLHAKQGRFAESRDCLRRALDVSRAVGLRQNESTAIGGLARAYLAEGRLAEAEEYQRRSLVLCREIAYRRGETAALSGLGSILSLQGRHAEARVMIEAQLELCREIGHRSGALQALHELANLAWEAGDLDRADRLFTECQEGCEEIGDPRLAVSTLRDRGRLLVTRGDVDAGRGALQSALELAREIDVPADQTLAACALACLPGGDAQAALDLFTAHRDTLSDYQVREARLMLWEATGDREHLVAARQHVEDAIARLPEQYRAGARDAPGLDSAILAAWREAFGDDDEPRGTESVTRIG